MTERVESHSEIVLPTDIVTPADDQWNRLTEYLKEQGEIPEDHLPVAMTLEVSAEEATTITDIETRQFSP